MAREALQPGTVRTEQLPPIENQDKYDGDVLIADRISEKEYNEELAFMEEPVTIRLEPSTEKNASNRYPVWVNGKPAEMLANGKWFPVGWLPVGQIITIKRKYLEVIARSKVTRIETEHDDSTVENPGNRVKRFTAPVHAYSIIEDKNPIGVEWLKELERRNW